MEKYTLFADKLTGKLLFNQPLAVYTSLGTFEKIIYQSYLYTFYWMLAVTRMTIIAILAFIWVILSYIPLINFICNRIFPKLILLINGYHHRVKILQGTKRFNTKIDKTALIAGRLTSPFDVLIYASKFHVYQVLVPEKFLTATNLTPGNYGTLTSLSIAFCRIMFLENLILQQSTEKTLKAPKLTKRTLIFPEGTSTNGYGTLQTYLPDTLFDQKQIVCVAASRPWKYIPLVHARFNLLSLFDETGVFSVSCSVKTVVLPTIYNRKRETVSRGLASASGVQLCEQTISDKLAYVSQVDE
ncbi:hypothetical protein SS50377_21059 [Spironucleus salmonicida]|uniref:Uncharacterized protein n=1 Tax=Spironucleus salmonicida TaxID=348837 RepID=V6LJ60_9EUKA|nr:hypothetical protein SS50377_21059 [Spironucleus salmonicida]|eukprot:EST43716.1 hypothetical protein SS50377_16770 [Spironucleus salmonicida]